METMFNDLRTERALAEDERMETQHDDSGLRLIRGRGHAPVPEKKPASESSVSSAPHSRTRVIDPTNTTEAANPFELGYPYELIETIGQGAMGAIWRAHDMKLMRDVAIKVARVDVEAQEPFHEARLAARVEHPNVTRVYDVGLTEEGTSFLVMELLRGEDLSRTLRREGKLSCRQAVLLARALLSALEAVHETGVVHRDIKPSNVFLAQVGGRRVPKLLDFGVACRSRPGESERIVGTPLYMAPEQLLHGSAASIKTDVFGVGALLFRMLTGTPLRPEDSHTTCLNEIVRRSDLSVLRNHADSDLRRIIERALAEDPQQRTPTARIFESELRDWCNQVSFRTHSDDFF